MMYNATDICFNKPYYFTLHLSRINDRKRRQKLQKTV